MKIEYTVHIWQEGYQFIAHALPLDVASSAFTPEQARIALDEAVRLFLETATERGTLEDVLEDAGYTLQDGQWISPVWVSIERHSLLVGV
ncbi:MAG TPA: hypothetical protein PLL06_14780 [Acidobacteriota bacterium]|nr:hypothetical protein [Acidobacteriota bacterium]HMZ80964.1 hypothetical protein [Acidobacteriota bacterium]HNC46302.1 hypothetical protein [Acidobacteriota bacterium]HNH81267.1 hypothetical protein [Acidobacteriota bacterium]